MPNCPFCLEEIKLGARKCPHCQTSLEPSAESGGNAVYVLDKGLVRFGKFVAAALGGFLIIGVYIYGLELKDAIKKTSEAEIEVKRGLLAIDVQKAALDGKVKEINESIERIKGIEREITTRGNETKTNAALVKELVEGIRRQKEDADQLVIEIRTRSLNAAEESLASAKRQERGIGSERGKLWKVGSSLRFRFLDGADEHKVIVRAAIKQWGMQVNLTISESDSADAELRISFKQPGSWAYPGTDALAISKNEPTINYGTLPLLSDPNAAIQTALHEFGHALGLVHEFQNPAAGKLFNVAAAEAFYAKNYGWSKQMVQQQLFAKVEYPGSRPYDPESVMNHELPANLFLNPDKRTRPGKELSESDKTYIASLYPRS